MNSAPLEEIPTAPQPLHKTPLEKSAAVRGGTLIVLALLLTVGIFLRVHPWAGFHDGFDTMGSDAKVKAQIGFDEALYMRYLAMLDLGSRGTTVSIDNSNDDSSLKAAAPAPRNFFPAVVDALRAYPAYCERYIEVQRAWPSALLPPTRFLYIFCGWLWHLATGWEPLHSLHAVSCVFTILTLFVSAIFARRLGGDGAMLGVTALMAVAPTQIHMGQHALIDGVFAFWAITCLWLLWENLHTPNKPLWLTLYTLAVALMVMTKENAAFTFSALCGALIVCWILKIGRVTLKLLLVSAVGPLLGVAVLMALAGGQENFVAIYKLLVEKAYNLKYAELFCDGPWQRYLLDLILVSPLVLLLAMGAIFSISREKQAHLYLLAFLALSYLFMANVKYSLNLRYANMWDMPLRFLAFSQLAVIAEKFRRAKVVALVAMIALVCALELRQYSIMFVRFPMYELVTDGLLRAVDIEKPKFPPGMKAP